MAITKEELEKLISVEPKIEKVATLSSDGKNLLMRIPKDVRDYFGLRKGTRVRFLVENKNKILLEILKADERKKKKRA